MEGLRGEKILQANLRLLADEAREHAERGQAMAAEAARMLAEPCVGHRERLSHFVQTVRAFFERTSLSTLSADERISFVREALAVFAEAGEPILAQELLPIRADIPERVSYFRTVYTDEAYDGFAACMHEPTVQYADAFFLSCEDVKNGDAGYCILPCENSDGVLSAMTALADRYELFRTGTYRAFHADGENATHFGLFSTAMPCVPKAKVLLLRFSATVSDAEGLSSHLSALCRLGLSVLRAELGAPSEEGEPSFTVLCEVTDEHLTATLLYLRIFAKRLLLRGLYEEIG